MTSGSVNVYLARFEFSEDWVGLERIAVFRSGPEVVSIQLPDSNECMIPWSALTTPRSIFVGAYGTNGEDIVLPTNWLSIGTIIEGVKPGDGVTPPPGDDIWDTTILGVGHGLKVVGGKVVVNTVDDFKGDNTLPITAAGVKTTVGNVEALLETI